MAETPTHAVVCNEEDQYALWPLGVPVPRGWTPVGTVGTEVECLRYVEAVWPDLRPRSLRRRADFGDRDQ